MEGFIILIIIILIFWLFFYLPVMGFAYIFLGEYALGLLNLLPLLCLIGFLLYQHFVTVPEKMRMATLSRMYNYPQRLGKKDIVNHWHCGFKDVIHDGLVTCTESDKKADLNHCLHIVDKMEKDGFFVNIHHAFRLTGCHIEIKDPTGHTITKIV